MVARWLTTLVLTMAVAIVPLAAVPAAADAGWAAGPDSAGDNTYDGYIDLPSAGSTVAAGASLLVGGWAVDKAAQGWAGIDDVQVYRGSLGSGGTMLAKGIVAQNRADVGAALGNPFWAASGFSAVVPAQTLAAGPTTLSVYVHTPGKGWWYKQVSVTVAGGQQTAAPAGAGSGGNGPGPVSAPLPGGAGSAFGSLVNVVEAPRWGEAVHTDRLYTLTGYALDRSATVNEGLQGTGIDRVQVYINGERDSGLYVGDADLAFSDPTASSAYGSQFANSGYRLTFNPTKYPTGSANLYVYARSAVTGKEAVALISIGITDTPSSTS